MSHWRWGSLQGLKYSCSQPVNLFQNAQINVVQAGLELVAVSLPSAGVIRHEPRAMGFSMNVL